jgi:hypothetical protein
MATVQTDVSLEAGVPRMNVRDLVILTVSGQIAHPVDKASPYRIGKDGIPRVLPGTGGIVINHRVGDRCVGLAADHVEPGVSLRNEQRPIKGVKDGPNLALNTYACVGNVAEVLTGPCKGKKGVVTGKHGGVNHVLVDFAPTVLRKLRIGDTIQIYAHGIGLRFIEHPRIAVTNCSPKLVRRWGLRSHPPKLQVPVTHLVPASIMGSGLGRNNAVRGDYDIQLFDPEINRRLRLSTLRFGDFVAIVHADTEYGRSYRRRFVTIGIVVHGDSTVSGHGPGVVTLMTGEARFIEPVMDTDANLAIVLGLRNLPPARAHLPLVRNSRSRWTQREPERDYRLLWMR